MVLWLKQHNGDGAVMIEIGNKKFKEKEHDFVTDEFTLAKLHGIIEDRRINKKPGSYTTYLFEKGVDKILKKIGEESTEVIIAGKSGSKADTVFEISDLVYHVMVLMSEMGITPDDIVNELASRHTTERE